MRHARTASLALTVVIAALAFTLSFTALTDLAAQVGTPAHLAPLWALLVDLTIVAGTIARIALPESTYATAVLWCSAGVSIAGNGYHAAEFGPIGIAVASVPPIALIAVTHLTTRLAPRATTATDTRPIYMPRGQRPIALATPWKEDTAA